MATRVLALSRSVAKMYTRTDTRLIITYTEGDLEKNAKLWYEQVDASVLAHYWGESNANDKAVEGMRKIQKVLHQKAADRDEKEETEAKEIKWKELVCILDVLEKKFGWEEMDGSKAYTHDDDPSHKSMVLGEYGAERIAIHG